MIDLPTDAAAACSPGALRIALGAALFALTNAFSTALYRNGGATVVSLYIVRSAIVYLINVLLVAWSEGREEASNVLFLRVSADAVNVAAS